MNIGFDIDGVLYPWHEAVYSHLRSTEKNFNLSFSEFWSNPENHMEKLEYLISLPFLYTSILPNKKIIEMLNKLSEDGHNIYYITGRPKEFSRITQGYLEKGKFPQSSNLVFSQLDKADCIRFLEIDVYIEDMVGNLYALLGICNLVAVEQPYNRSERENLEKRGVKFIPTVLQFPEVIKNGVFSL